MDYFSVLDHSLSILGSEHGYPQKEPYCLLEDRGISAILEDSEPLWLILCLTLWMGTLSFPLVKPLLYFFVIHYKLKLMNGIIFMAVVILGHGIMGRV